MVRSIKKNDLLPISSKKQPIHLKKLEFKNIKGIIITGLATFLVLMLLFWLRGLAPFGTKSLVVMDADIQYIDFFSYLKDVFEGKNSIGYTFGKTLGGTNIAVFSYYLSSPFNLLLVFFDRSRLHTFFDLVVALKLSLASMTFAYFGLKRFDRRNTGTMVDSLVRALIAMGYGLCQYNIAQSSNIMWLDGVYMLPLMLLQVSNIVNGKKAHTLPIVVGAAIIFNWYSAGIDCIFTGFWFLFELMLYVAEKKFDLKYFLRCVIKYIVGMISGVMVSAVLFFPTFGALKKSTRGSLHIGDVKDLSFIGELPSALQKYTYGSASEYGSVALFCGSLAIVLAIFAVLNARISALKRAVLSGLLMGSVLIFYWHPFFTMFSLFQWVSSYHYRYSYVAVFSILFLALVGINELNTKEQARQLVKIAVIFSGLVIILRYCKEINDLKAVYATAVMVVVEALLLAYIKSENQNKLLRNLLVAVLAVAGIADLSANTVLLLKANSADNVAHNNSYFETQRKTIASVKSQDDTFYRISQTMTRSMGKATDLTANYNEGLAYNYASISGYTSSPDDIQREFLDRLGYRINGENMCITNTSILGADSLMGVKYVLSPYGIMGLSKISDIDSNGKAVYRNPYALPFAFVYDDTGYEVNGETNPFEYQNELYKKLFNTTENLYRPIEYDLTCGDGNCGAKMQLHISDTLTGPVYGNIPWNYEADSSIYINGEYATRYAGWCCPAVFYIPAEEGQECEVEVRADVDNFDFNQAQFYALDLDVLSKCKGLADAGAVSNMAVKNGHVTLSVNAEENQRLFLSVAADDDWTITLNGEKAETELIGNCLYSIKLKGGVNNVTMTYHVPYLKLGMIVTGLMLLIWVGYICFNKEY